MPPLGTLPTFGMRSLGSERQRSYTCDLRPWDLRLQIHPCARYSEPYGSL
jgi:hypothetical protein